MRAGFVEGCGRRRLACLLFDWPSWGMRAALALIAKRGAIAAWRWQRCVGAGFLASVGTAAGSVSQYVVAHRRLAKQGHQRRPRRSEAACQPGQVEGQHWCRRRTSGKRPCCVGLAEERRAVICVASEHAPIRLGALCAPARRWMPVETPRRLQYGRTDCRCALCGLMGRSARRSTHTGRPALARRDRMVLTIKPIRSTGRDAVRERKIALIPNASEPATARSNAAHRATRR